MFMIEIELVHVLRKKIHTPSLYGRMIIGVAHILPLIAINPIVFLKA